MSSLPSSLASWPAFTSCWYMARISLRWWSSSRRTLSRPPSSSILLLVAVLSLRGATVLSYLQIDGENRGCKGAGLLQRGAMVLHSSSQGKAAVELLPEHQAGELMGQRERPERELEVGLGAQLGGHAEVGAEHEGEGVRPVVARRLQE